MYILKKSNVNASTLEEGIGTLSNNMLKTIQGIIVLNSLT
jgi:hypothetical protein